MFGAIAKTYLAKKIDIDPEKIVVVSVMPCLAKKFEAKREELGSNNEGSDVDYVISTRELARMIHEAGLNFPELPDGDFDSIMGESSGASVIFGTSGGVIEAVVRTVAAWVDGKAPENVSFTQLRGIEGVREAKVMVGGKTVSIAIAHGLGNARQLLTEIRDGKAHYDAIEIMACPSGCVGGGGQPYHHNDVNVLKLRAKAIYKEDEGKTRRLAHENKEVQQLYDEFLGERYGEKAHELLHTTFKKRDQL
jgi:iron only hydrogenase large subunit-like protein